MWSSQTVKTDKIMRSNGPSKMVGSVLPGGQARESTHIARDRKELGLPRFSEISDDKVMDLIGDVKESMHTKVGREKIESQCIHRGARVQRRRIRVAQGELGIIQDRPGRKERKEYYTSVGPDWTW